MMDAIDQEVVGRSNVHVLRQMLGGQGTAIFVQVLWTRLWAAAGKCSETAIPSRQASGSVARERLWHWRRGYSIHQMYNIPLWHWKRPVIAGWRPHVSAACQLHEVGACLRMCLAAVTRRTMTEPIRLANHRVLHPVSPQQAPVELRESS